MISDTNLKEPDHWDGVTDIVVIGSGFAGLSAAIEASNSGASVIVLEKMKAPGGNSLISDGGLAAAGTDEQNRLGIIDSPDLMYADMVKAGLEMNYPDLLRTLVDNSKSAYEWSRDYLNVEFLDRIDIFGGHAVQRCFTAKNTSGVTIIKKLMEKIRELGIEIRFQSYFTGFTADEFGRISGIKYREFYNYKQDSTGPVKYLKAKKAVILASGGFGADIDFRSTQDPRLSKEIDTTNQPFATAEVLKEALKIGASPVQLSQIQLGPWASPDEIGFGDGPAFSEYIVFQYGIVIDPQTGKRIVNELSDRKTVSDSILKTGHPCIGIADSSAVIKSGWNIDKCIKKQVVKKYDSIESLAAAYDINLENLKETKDRFNIFIDNKNDPDFKKTIINTASKIEKFPFFAIRLWPKIHYTMGGLGINRKAQVLDLEGIPVNGLYAAGEVTGGVHGASRLGSCAITDCLVFGRISGRNAAEELC
ncbi:MAG: flavocytochrome c [Spirochaetota bacterium]|nr:flavocytochrome c [Spirochaetota bacterium]